MNEEQRQIKGKRWEKESKGMRRASRERGGEISQPLGGGYGLLGVKNKNRHFNKNNLQNILPVSKICLPLFRPNERAGKI